MLVCNVCEHFEVCVGRFEVKIVKILSASKVCADRQSVESRSLPLPLY